MKIALINDNSQASKNKIIYNSLKKVTDKKNYEIINIGMSENDDKELTYVQIGLIASILLTTKTVDFVITGCGTGEGAMMSCNSFPNVFCGLIAEPLDAYLFSQINGGNAVSIPFAKGFGWGAELNLENIFEQLFKENECKGYPIERSLSEKINREKLKEIKNITNKDLLTILKSLDKEFVTSAIDRKIIKELIINNNNEIFDYLKGLLK